MANIDRRMVTLRKVSSIYSIEGADFIELVKVDGWQCVVKKGEFKVGDYGVYFEIDSALPVKDPRFSFLKPNKVFNGESVAVLTTAKFKKQLSQGLLLPLSLFPELLVKKRFFGLWKQALTPEQVAGLEANLDNILGIQKYEKEAEQEDPPWLKRFDIFPKKWKVWFYNKIYRKVKKGRAMSTFPSFIPRTDEPRIQNCYSSLIREPEVEYEVTVKLDGSSMTFWVYNEKFGFASRNQTLNKSNGGNWGRLVEKHQLDSKFLDYIKEKGINIAFQGELLGPGIQGNYENQSEFDFYLFEIYDIDNKVYYTPEQRLAFLEEYNLSTGSKIQHVPKLCTSYLSQYSDLDTLLQSAEGPGMNVKKREGVVWKRMDGKGSFKIISNSYLLNKK